MKKTVLLFGALLLLLCGCGGEDRQMRQALDFREKLLSADGCGFHCTVTADCEPVVYEFEMDCEYQKGVGSFVLSAPQELAGIGATVSGDGSSLDFQGVRLALEDTAGGKLAPLGTPWILGNAWESGYITAAGDDDGRCRITFSVGYDEDTVLVDTWLENGSPVRAEVSSGGKTVLFCEIRDFFRTSGGAVS